VLYVSANAQDTGEQQAEEVEEHKLEKNRCLSGNGFLLSKEEQGVSWVQQMLMESFQ